MYFSQAAFFARSVCFRRGLSSFSRCQACPCTFQEPRPPLTKQIHPPNCHRRGGGKTGSLCTGPNFVHPPPTPESTLLGVGGRIELKNKRGGAYKIPAAGGFKIYTPPPLSLKMPSGPKWGEGGGGVYNFSLDCGVS